MLNREQILSGFDRELAEVDVPQWGGPVTVAALSAGDRAGVLADFAEAHKYREQGDSAGFGRRWAVIQVRLVIMSVVDDSNQRIFAAEDEAQLLDKSPEVIGLLSDAILQLNKFAVSAVEDDAKN